MQLFDARVKSPVENWDDGVAENVGVQAPERVELTEWASKTTHIAEPG